MEELNQPTERGLSRRTVVKGAAWSVPVLAAAVAMPMAAATGGGVDLSPSLGATIDLSLMLGPVTLASISTPDSVTINNVGPVPSTGTETVQISYDSSLLTLNIAQVGGISVAGSDGNYTITLPVIPAGGSLTINLGTTLDSLLDLTLLNQILGGGTPQMTAIVAGDDVTANNSDVRNIGISIL